MSVTLRKVTEGDLEQIMRWRMDPEITRYMNTDPKLTLEGQKKWFAKVQQDPDVSYWIIEIDGSRRHQLHRADESHRRSGMGLLRGREKTAQHPDGTGAGNEYV